MIGSRFIRRATATVRDRRASAEDIQSCIRVGVSLEATVPTSEPSLALARTLVDDSACRTLLARVGRVYLNERPAALFQLVGQLPFEAMPALFVNAFGKAAIGPHHAGGFQVLQSDYPKSPCDVRAGAVLPFLANAGDLGCEPSDTKALFPVAVGAALPAREDALGLSFPALQSRRVRRGKHLAGRKRQRVGNAPIYADARQRGRLHFMFDFASEDHVPAKATLRHGHVHHAARERAGGAIAYPSNLLDANEPPAFRDVSRSSLSPLKPNAVIDASSAHCGIAGAAREEVGERPVQIADGLREGRRVRLSQPIDFGSELGDFAALRGKIETPARTPPIAPLFERQIIDKAGCADELREPFCLRFRGVEPVAKCPLNHASFLPHCEVEMKEIAA